MIDEESNEEGIGWPSYVDFLSTFAFILIIFVGSLLYLMSGGLGRATLISETHGIRSQLTADHFTYVIRGNQVVISLKDQVNFATGCPQADGHTCQGIPPGDQAHLRKLGEVIGRYHNYRYIMVEGQTDATPYPNDPFGNWDLSARRALAVLRYFYLCGDCGYDQKEIQKKLVLKGLGDTMASTDKQDRATDRRVDVVLDYGTIRKQETHP